MRNRRPKLKREPTIADQAAEVTRSLADELEVQISNSFVILYKRENDFVSVTIPLGAPKDFEDRLRAKIIEAGLYDEVSFSYRTEGKSVWLSVDRR